MGYKKLKPKNPIRLYNYILWWNAFFVLAGFYAISLVSYKYFMGTVEWWRLALQIGAVLLLAWSSMYIWHNRKNTMKTTAYAFYRMKKKIYDSIFRGKPFEMPEPETDWDMEHDQLMVLLYNREMYNYMQNIQEYKDHPKFNSGAFMNLKIHEEWSKRLDFDDSW